MEDNNFTISNFTSVQDLIEMTGTKCLTNIGKEEYSMNWACMQENGLIEINQWFHKIAFICFFFGLFRLLFPWLLKYIIFKNKKLNDLLHNDFTMKVINGILDATTGFLLMAIGLISWWLINVKIP